MYLFLGSFNGKIGLPSQLVCMGDTLFFLFPPQLEHARMTQTELMRESFHHNQEINELLKKQDELQDRLAEEARAREQLALELHRAEGEFFWIT